MGKFRIIDELEPAGDFKIAQSSDIAYNDKSVGETLDDLTLVAEQVTANTSAIAQNTSDISDQSGKIETLTGKVTAAETAIAGKASAEAVTQLQTEMDVQKARMDQLVEDPEVGVDEIADARIDSTGKTYANLGDHIRGTETSLKETITSVFEGAYDTEYNLSAFYKNVDVSGSNVTIKSNGIGTYNITGTANSNTPIYLFKDENVVFKAGQKYVINLAETGSVQRGIQLNSVSTTGTTTVLIQGSIKKDQEFVVPADNASLQMRYLIRSGDAYSNVLTVEIKNLLNKSLIDADMIKTDTEYHFETGISTFRTNWKAGRIYGAYGEYTDSGNNAYTRVSSEPFKPQSTGKADIIIPDGISVTVWRYPSASCVSGEGRQIGAIYSASAQFDINKDYWYLICAFRSDDTTGSQHTSPTRDELKATYVQYSNTNDFYRRNDATIANSASKAILHEDALKTSQANLVTLFPVSEQTTNGIKYTPCGGGKFKLNGTKTTTSIYYINNNNTQTILEAGEKYVVNVSTQHNIVTQIIYTVTGDTDYNILANGVNINSTITMPDVFNKLLIRMICNETGEVNDAEITINIRKYSEFIGTASSDYATIYKDKEEELVQKVATAKNGSILTFVVTTDAHGFEQDDNTRKLIDVSKVGAKIAEEVNADFRVDLGDVFTDTDDTTANARVMNKYITQANNSFVPFVYAQGNHETFGGHHDAEGHPIQALDQSQVAMIGLTGRKLNAVRNDAEPMGGYYYFDFPERKVRVYCLNSKSNVYTNEQVTWVSRTLASMPSDYGVVIMLHIPMIEEARWNGHAIPENDEAMRTVLSDFVSGGGRILAIIHGHMHWDNMFKVNDLNCPVICVASSTLDNTPIGDTACSGGSPNRPSRAWDYSQYAIDTVCIDTVTGNIKMFRFGAGADRTYTR